MVNKETMALEEALINVGTTARAWEAADTWEEGKQRWEAYIQARAVAKELGGHESQIREAMQATCEHHWHWKGDAEECCKCDARVSYSVC